MNPQTRREAVDLFTQIRSEIKNISGIDIAIAVPFIHLVPLVSTRGRATKPAIGAQDAFWESAGSYTGEVSVAQVADAGATHVIVGHSERRALGETNEQIAKKMKTVLYTGLTAVLCIGEHERDEDGVYLGWLENQLLESLAGVSGKYFPKLVIAYEPVWAIGGDTAMDPIQIHEMVIMIRRSLKRKYGQSVANGTRIIYGGSVDDTNITDIMTHGEVNGVLPGRASRDPHVFRYIADVVRNSSQ